MTREQAAACIDAAHNVPELLENWERCDLDQLYAELRAYDASWPSGRLLRVFEEAVRQP